MEEKILTKELVIKLGLDKVPVITADMLDGFIIIEDYAFSCCEELTSITISNNIINIGKEVFAYCINLTTITIPNSVKSIGYGAFEHCTSLTSVNIPDSVTIISGGTFTNCIGLTSIEIPNSVTDINPCAFIGCSNLTSIIISDSVTYIGSNAFYNCTRLTSIEIPNSVTHIGGCTFENCISLISVIIKDKTYEKQTVINGKCKAYKAFNADMTCRGFQYEEGKTYKFEGEPILCRQGFHACLNLTDVFNYYDGKFGKNIVVHEVELEGVSDEHKYDSKVVANKITIGKRIL